MEEVPVATLTERMAAHRAEVILLLLSSGICLVSLFVFVSAGNSTVEEGIRVERERAGVSAIDDTYYLDVEGAVVHPDVYEVSSSARLKDVIVLAGGLSANADRVYFSQHFNLASKVNDQQKVYIPTKREVRDGLVAGAQTTKNSEGVVGESENTAQINVNTASETVLETLFGVGPATAKKIVQGRPYEKVEDLLDKKVVNSRVFEMIKRDIVAF